MTYNESQVIVPGSEAEIRRLGGLCSVPMSLSSRLLQPSDRLHYNNLSTNHVTRAYDVTVFGPQSTSQQQSITSCSASQFWCSSSTL